MGIEQNKRTARELVEGLGSAHEDRTFDHLHDEALWTVMAHPDSFPSRGP